MPAINAKERNVTLKEIIETACLKYTDIRQAAECALRLVTKHEDVKKAELHRIVWKGVSEFIFERQYDWRASAKRCTRGIEAIAAAGETLKSSLFDTWILNGLRLGDYTGRDMPTFAAQARVQANGCLKNAMFYDWLAAKAGKKRIRDAISEHQAANTWNDIEKTFAVGDEAAAS